MRQIDPDLKLKRHSSIGMPLLVSFLRLAGGCARSAKHVIVFCVIRNLDPPVVVGVIRI
jgi:hypothetical protein